jgi:hypothetical protein
MGKGWPEIVLLVNATNPTAHKQTHPPRTRLGLFGQLSGLGPGPGPVAGARCGTAMPGQGVALSAGFTSGCESQAFGCHVDS